MGRERRDGLDGLPSWQRIEARPTATVTIRVSRRSHLRIGRLARRLVADRVLTFDQVVAVGLDALERLVKEDDG